MDNSLNEAVCINRATVLDLQVLVNCNAKATYADFSSLLCFFAKSSGNRIDPDRSQHWEHLLSTTLEGLHHTQPETRPPLRGSLSAHSC